MPGGTCQPGGSCTTRTTKPKPSVAKKPKKAVKPTKKTTLAKKSSCVSCRPSGTTKAKKPAQTSKVSEIKFIAGSNFSLVHSVDRNHAALAVNTAVSTSVRPRTQFRL